MPSSHRIARIAPLAGVGLLLGLLAQPAAAAEPIKIGFGMGLTGGLASAGKAALLGMKIWEEETNAKGGLLGRPVKLIYYDDQSNPATVPGIFTKLIDVDKIDIAMGDYGTNLVAPAMPIVIQKKMAFFGLFAMDVNKEFQYKRYFSMLPTGTMDPAVSFSRGFFEVAAAQNPKPKTLAIIAADAEFPHTAAIGARKSAKDVGLQIVYDKTYPPATTDYTPIVRAIDAANADVVMSLSYPPDAVGMIRAANEVGLKAKIFGGGLVGTQYATIRQQLGAQLNGIINYDFWQPAKTLVFPGIDEFLKKYQARAAGEGVDPLGYYLPPFAYANLQVMAAAVEATKSLDQDKMADWLHKSKIPTIVGDIEYGPNGEWKEGRVLMLQYHDVEGSDLAQWKDDRRQTILWPPQYATGKAIYPYADAKKK